MSKITTHILDTARGCPAEGVRVSLWGGSAGEKEIASAFTNKDGRIADWGVGGSSDGGSGGDSESGAAPAAGAASGGKGSSDMVTGSGIYKIRFETREYFDKQSVPTFYPFVEIHFETAADGHYHIPLLLSPFGYSTYRGS